MCHYISTHLYYYKHFDTTCHRNQVFLRRLNVIIKTVAHDITKNLILRVHKIKYSD